MRPQEAELEVLRQARELWRKHRCTHSYAVDDLGHRVSVLSADAVRFCAVGSVYRVMGVNPVDSTPRTALRMVYLGAAGANDRRDWAGVEKIFDEVEEEVRDEL